MMNKEKNYYKEDFEEPSFLDPKKLKVLNDRIASGEVTCNIEEPDDCESCSG